MPTWHTVVLPHIPTPQVPPPAPRPHPRCPLSPLRLTLSGRSTRFRASDSLATPSPPPRLALPALLQVPPGRPAPTALPHGALQGWPCLPRPGQAAPASARGSAMVPAALVLPGSGEAVPWEHRHPRNGGEKGGDGEERRNVAVVTSEVALPIRRAETATPKPLPGREGKWIGTV